MTLSYFDVQCTSVSRSPIFDISTCMILKQVTSRCQKWMKESCIDVFDPVGCPAALVFCEKHLVEPVLRSGLNPYDLRKECEGGIDDALCYPVAKHIVRYLERPDVRSELGVDPSLPQDFAMCSTTVGNRFDSRMDGAHPTHLYVAALLERNVKTLIFAGVADFMCNWVGNERWTLALEWTGREAFSSAKLREWFVGGKVAGVTRSAGGLTFATIHNAGHMVPYDRPRESLEMVQRWLAGKDL